MGQEHFEISAGEGTVEFWTASRLGFDPRGPMRVARDALRASLAGLQATEGRVLRAELLCEDEGFFDVENVLIYNVGASSLTHATTFGLHVTTEKAKPPPAPSSRALPYLHRYSLEVVPQRPSTKPSMEFSLQGLSSSTKPHVVWWAACQATPAKSSILPGTFSVYVEVPARAAIANVVKPLLDGIICAMHPNPEPDREAVGRLSVRTGWSEAAIAANLRSPPVPCLDPRTVVRPYRDFIKWDPADELCQEFVVVKAGSPSTCKVWVTSTNGTAP